MTQPIEIPDMIEVKVRLLNETSTGWLITQNDRRQAFWADKAEVEIPDLHEIKPMATARMSRAYAVKKGVRYI